jgi:hypothetical protein
MGTSTWTGPIKAGSIPYTSGNIVGTNVANAGYAVMVQTASITQAGTASAVATGIVLPKNSEIISIDVFATAGWDGTDKTISFGTTVTSTELATAVDLTAVGRTIATPGTDATRTGKWINIGTSDVAIYALSVNTGAGVGRLVVRYIQSNN